MKCGYGFKTGYGFKQILSKAPLSSQWILGSYTLKVYAPVTGGWCGGYGGGISYSYTSDQPTLNDLGLSPISGTNTCHSTIKKIYITGIKKIRFTVYMWSNQRDVTIGISNTLFGPMAKALTTFVYNGTTATLELDVSGYEGEYYIYLFHASEASLGVRGCYLSTT